MATGTNNCLVVYPVVIVQVEGVKCQVLLDTAAGSSYASAALLDSAQVTACQATGSHRDDVWGYNQGSGNSHH